jgi:hypothetical protein
MKKWKELEVEEKVERLRWFSVFDSIEMALIAICLLLLIFKGV